MSPEDHYRDYAKELSGNWKKFESFGWHNEPENPEDWCIVYTSNRDSGILEESNAVQFEEVLSKFPENQCRSESHNHWAVGHVDGWAIKVYNSKGEFTGAFKAYCDLALALESYPVLNEEDYSRREYEATLENIESNRAYFLKDDAPEDWPAKVFSWLWTNNQRELDSRDDQGGDPSEKAVEKALKALGFWDEQDS